MKAEAMTPLIDLLGLFVCGLEVGLEQSRKVLVGYADPLVLDTNCSMHQVDVSVHLSY